jgi:hypothetical protein
LHLFVNFSNIVLASSPLGTSKRLGGVFHEITAQTEPHLQIVWIQRISLLVVSFFLSWTQELQVHSTYQLRLAVATPLLLGRRELQE